MSAGFPSTMPDGNASVVNGSPGNRQANFSFLLNGSLVFPEQLSPQTTLLDFLRSRGLTGAKEGCAEGECGACNVVFVTGDASGNIDRSEYRAINSCLIFLPMAAGQEIYTVEALARNGRLSAVQKAMAEGGGSQCGYCTPGFVMSLFAEYYRPGRQGACDPHAMGGNLCRCTGYRPIRDAALSLSEDAPKDSFSERLAYAAPKLTQLRHEVEGAMFLRPESLEECIAEAQQPGATLIAGGTDLAIESNLRYRRWRRLISLDAVGELREFREETGRIRIGAALGLTDIAAHWSSAPPWFREWLALFASPTLRHRATLGGNLATASPIGDSAPLLLALDAQLELAGPRGRRVVALDTFFLDRRKTVLQPGELIASIDVPKPLPVVLRFYKIAKRQMDDISTVAAAFALNLDRRGRVERARIALGGVAATPIRVTAAEDAVTGTTWDFDAVRRAQAALELNLHPISDHRGSAEYRLEVAKALVEKFWSETQEGAA
jgi:xanthine dehydrogenase small subunit